jgi:hypothetical protein
MGHEEAVRTQAVEKYLLGQLAAEARDQFEEHFFECALCAEDIRTGLVFMDNAAAELAPAPAVAATIAARKAGWLDWFRIDWRQPALAMPLVALIVVSALWVRDHGRLRDAMVAASGPQIVTSEPLDITRGEAPIAVNRGERYFALTFNIDTDRDTLPDYIIEIRGNGVPPAKITAPRRALGISYELLLPTERYKPGRYEFTVRGGPDTDGRVVKQFERELE